MGTGDLNVLVKLVQAGAGGVAIACMLLSFWLLLTINRQPHTGATLPVLKEKNRSACFYMGFSVLCLSLAFASAWFTSKPTSVVSEVRVMWNPDEKPKFLHQEELVPKAYFYRDSVKRYLRKGEKPDCPGGCNIVLDYQALVDHIYSLPLLTGATLSSSEAGVGQ